MMMTINDYKELFGTWEQAIGTVLSAFSATPSLINNKKIQNDLSLIGNAMQATGSAVVADMEEGLSFSKIGNQLQSVGSAVALGGLILPVGDKTEDLLNFQGNLLQALGSAVVIPDIFKSNHVTVEDVLNFQAALLQTIGSAMQGLAVKIENAEKKQWVNLAGAWIQTVGAVLAALLLTKEFLDKEEQEYTDSLRT